MLSVVRSNTRSDTDPTMATVGHGTFLANWVSMASGYRFRRSGEYGITTLEVEGLDFDLQVKIISQLEKRERRVIIRSFLRQIKPWLRFFKSAAVGHSGHGEIFIKRNLKRGIRGFQSELLTTESGRLGYKIRMKRLKLNLTQAETAALLGLRRSHLSEVERGLHLPMRKMRLKIDEFLDRPL